MNCGPILDQAVLIHVAVALGFPEDPFGTDVIDRALFRTYTQEEELVLYITLFNDKIGEP